MRRRRFAWHDQGGEPGAWEIEDLAPPIVAPDWVAGLIKGSGKATLKDVRKDYGNPIDWDEEHAKGLVEATERGELIKITKVHSSKASVII